MVTAAFVEFKAGLDHELRRSFLPMQAQQNTLSGKQSIRRS